MKQLVFFYIATPKGESRPIELHREGECMRAMGGGESYDSSPNTGCARFKRKRLRGAEWVLRLRKIN